MTGVQGTSSDEIRGDWSNIKGTEYHLLYALWLILRKHAASVAFYQGNDLVAHPQVIRPSSPPSPGTELDDNDEDSAPVSLHTGHGASDVWVQLKATKSPWSPSRLMAKNLLINFVHNALHSERLGRSWRASLVTQGLVQRSEVEDFVRSPRRYRDLNKRLTEVVNITRERLRKEGWSAAEVSPPRLRRVALAVLSQLAQSEPVPLGMLKSDIETELTHAYQDRDVVRQIGDSLIGAMLRDAGLGPGGAHAYDADWINHAAGRPVVKLGLLNDNPVAACDAAVRRAASELKYEEGRFTPRSRLANVLGRFMSAKETLFALVGASGSGKSWGLVHWAQEDLDGRLRLLIPGADLDDSTPLQSLVANRLRPFSSAQWEDELFLRRLTAAAELEGRGPVTLLVEDLVPTRDVNAYRRNLARIARECRARGIKLVLACQRHVWELHQLGAEMSLDDLFVMSANLPREDHAAAPSDETTPSSYAASTRILDGRGYSFLLAEFSPEEQRDALRKRLPRARADQIADQLRAPGFTLLRSPYLLARYLERYIVALEGTDEAPPMEADDLLDWYIDASVQKAALELSCSPDDLRPAFSALVEALWTSRPAGLTFALASRHLSAEFPERGIDALAALRRSGLLTVEGPVRITEPLVADRLFAARAGEQLRLRGNDFLDELSVETDSGLVVALLRSETPDPVAVGERLMARNGEWAGPVAAGLAQGSPNDWRSLAILTTLLGSDEERPSRAAFGALGQIAARGERSWKWAAEMYLGDHAQKWHRGARVLAGVMEYRPQRVEAAIRTRLTRALHIDEIPPNNRERLRKWLTSGSLDALRGINHESAAQVGERVVRRYERLGGGGRGRDRDWNFIDDLDHARGRIALFGDGEYLRILLEELSTGSEVARYRAALALRPVIAERPDSVREVVCERLAAETDWLVLERLLLIAFHLIERYPDELLAALRQSRALNFGEPLRTTGLVLSLLGNLAGKRHAEVEQLLPARLDAHEGETRAFLAEMLAYAWWRCAERNDALRDRLRALAEPDLTDVPDECIPFALRGSAIALLGLMCVEQGVSADELTGQQVFYPNMGTDFLYVETIELFRKHAGLLRRHPSFGRFKELLVDCVREEEEKTQDRPIQPVRQAQFRCAAMCLELLVHIAALMDDPLPLLNSLPRNWQAIRAATRLLEMGRTEAPVVAFARDSFAGLEHEGTTQALEERRLCQAQLALLEEDDQASLREQRRSSGDFILFQKPGNSLGLSVLAAKEPGNLLSHLDESIQTEHDLPTLYYLVEDARSWQTLLIARVYARMFNSAPIDIHEARDLCEQMLIAVRALPESPLCQEYVAVYSAIDALLRGQNPPIPVLPARPADAAGNLIHGSHEVAAEVLARPTEGQPGGSEAAWFDDYLYDRRGWLETYFYELRHSLLLRGGNYMMYFFPATRLAFAAVGVKAGRKDPAGRLMAERWETYNQLRDQLDLLDHASLEHYGADRIARALGDFERRAAVAPRDERLQNWLGVLLLLLGRVPEAEATIQRSLALPGCRGEARASALYNLACVYARQNNEDACRHALEESARLKRPDRRSLAEDPDFQSVRDREWFHTLLEADA